ncbi:MAG: glycosyltransferase [Candidatus Sericytochromatia bacterium]
MPLSVIVTTAPGRETNLAASLLQLVRQSYRDFEVLVCDDGSAGSEIVKLFEKMLNLRYFWRPNDHNVGRSRNLGLAQARHQHLVLLDGDILLNPAALEAYAGLFSRWPERLWLGYFGHISDYKAPSAFVTGRTVNYLDPRFSQYGHEMIQPAPLLLAEPAWKFWSANVGIPRAALERVGGFDESYLGWGYEDAECAFRLLQAGYEIHVSLDVWGEHQVHDYNEPFHLHFVEAGHKGKIFLDTHTHPKLNYRVEVIGSKSVGKALCHRVMNEYLLQDPSFNDKFRACVEDPRARLVMRYTEDRKWELGVALPKGE